jgi:hypothetical protein
MQYSVTQSRRIGDTGCACSKVAGWQLGGRYPCVGSRASSQSAIRSAVGGSMFASTTTM